MVNQSTLFLWVLLMIEFLLWMLEVLDLAASRDQVGDQCFLFVALKPMVIFWVCGAYVGGGVGAELLKPNLGIQWLYP